MRVLEPVPMTIRATNILDDEAPAWSAVTAYTTGQQVQHDFAIWEAVSGNTNQVPSSSSLYWAKRRAVRSRRAFDNRLGSKTDPASGPVTYTLRPTVTADTIAFLGLDANDVQVTVLDGAATLYDQTRQTVQTFLTTSAFEWTYGGVEYETDLFFTEISGYGGVDIEVTVSADTGPASVSEIVVGTMTDLGITTAADIGFDDYSIKERDEFGALYVVERDYSRPITFTLYVPKENAQAVEQVMGRLRATPAVYIGSFDHPEFGTTVYGYLSTYRHVVDADQYTVFSVEIEGLT